MAIITIVFAAVVPQFRVINNSWDSKRGNAEMLQNGRVLMDHIFRNLSKAVRITAVSDSGETNGYIEFENNDGNDIRYDIGADSYVEFGPVGNLSDLAGPVSSLKFTCYDDNDLDTSITDVNSIRFVNVQATFSNSALLAQDKTFSTSVYLRTGQYNPCSSGLVGWWKLDETSGLTAADSSGNGNDGSLENMAGNEWTTGAVGGSLEFDGNNDYIVRSSTSSLNLPTAWTISVWVNFVGNPSQEYIVTRNTNNTSTMQYGIYVRTPASGGAVGAVLDGSTIDIASVSWSMGTWTHIAVTWDGGDVIAYVDGDPVGSTTYSGALPDQGDWFNIGRRSNSVPGTSSNGLFDGFIDDVRVYSRALNPAEIDQLATILRYVEFNWAKVSSDSTSITILTPDTNEGDLLIAAIATDGVTSISPPGGEGWTAINVSDYDGEVTLGAWWKPADASESSSHQFTWSSPEKAYGWMMRFTGHDSNDPINAWASSGESSSTPTSPAVTTTVDNCMIVRLGAFDDDDITVDDPGLPSEYTAITMDSSGGIGSILFQDGFETDFANWTTDWDRSSSVYHSGSWSAQAGKGDNDLTSNDIDTGSYSAFTIEFWYRVVGIDDNDDVYLQLFDGSDYDDYFEVGNQPEGVWLQYQETITDVQYLHSNFRIRFAGGSIDQNENLWLDDVVISLPGSGNVSGGAGYVAQSDSGDSGTATFSLNSANEAQMITIAIAPEEVSTSLDGCGSSIVP